MEYFLFIELSKLLLFYKILKFLTSNDGKNLKPKFSVSATLYGLFTILNVLSVPEVSLRKLKEDGLAPETESLKTRMIGLFPININQIKRIQYNDFYKIK